MFKRTRRDGASTRLLEEKVYAQVMQEIEAGFRRDGLWAKALADSGGSEEMCKSLYIRYRAQAIVDEAEILASAHAASEYTKQSQYSGGGRAKPAVIDLFVSTGTITESELLQLFDVPCDIPKIIEARDRIRGNSLLHCSAMHGWEHGVRVLLKHGANRNDRNGNGRTPGEVAQSYEIGALINNWAGAENSAG